MDLVPVLEGILFLVGDEGIEIEELKNVLDVEDDKLKELIENLKKDYESPRRGLRVEYLGKKLKLVTKKEHKEYYEALVDEEINSNLTPASMEVLAIIAYNQPITRVKVDEIRGINSSHLVRKLLLKNLIKDMGKSDAPGRPILYGTTDSFLDYFGLKTIEDLPPLTDVELSDEETDLFESKYKEEV